MTHLRTIPSDEPGWKYGSIAGYFVVTAFDGVADHIDRGEPLLTQEEATARHARADQALNPRIVRMEMQVQWLDMTAVYAKKEA